MAFKVAGFVGVVGLALFVSSSAWAEEPPASSTTPASSTPAVDFEEPRAGRDQAGRDHDAARSSGWYGYQLLAADAVAATMVVGGLALQVKGSDVPLAPVGFGVYAMAAPLLHVRNHEHARAGLSFGLRTVLPVLGGLAGSLFDTCNPHQSLFCSEDGRSTVPVYAVLGGLLGAVTAVVVDDVALANHSSSSDAEVKQRPRSSASLSVSPSFGANTKGAFAGFAGTF